MAYPLTRTVVRAIPRAGVVLRLDLDGVYIREAKRRTWYGPIAYGKLLLDGARQYVAEQDAARRAARKAAGKPARRVTTRTRR